MTTDTTTTPVLITAEILADALDKVVEKYGAERTYKDVEPDFDFESGTCKYMLNDEPACIFGAALFDELGLPYRPEYENTGIAGVLGKLCQDGVIEEVPRSFAVRDAAFIAQDNQDQGKTWGECAAVFRENVTIH